MILGLSIPPHDRHLGTASEPSSPPRGHSMGGCSAPLLMLREGCTAAARAGGGGRAASHRGRLLCTEAVSSAPQPSLAVMRASSRCAGSSPWLYISSAPQSGCQRRPGRISVGRAQRWSPVPLSPPKREQSCRGGSTPASGAFLAASDRSILGDCSACLAGDAAPLRQPGPAGRIMGRAQPSRRDIEPVSHWVTVCWAVWHDMAASPGWWQLGHAHG